MVNFTVRSVPRFYRSIPSLLPPSIPPGIQLPVPSLNPRLNPLALPTLAPWLDSVVDSTIRFHRSVLPFDPAVRLRRSIPPSTRSFDSVAPSYSVSPFRRPIAPLTPSRDFNIRSTARFHCSIRPLIPSLDSDG